MEDVQRYDAHRAWFRRVRDRHFCMAVQAKETALGNAYRIAHQFSIVPVGPHHDWNRCGPAVEHVLAVYSVELESPFALAGSHVLHARLCHASAFARECPARSRLSPPIQTIDSGVRREVREDHDSVLPVYRGTRLHPAGNAPVVARGADAPWWK